MRAQHGGECGVEALVRLQLTQRIGECRFETAVLLLGTGVARTGLAAQVVLVGAAFDPIGAAAAVDEVAAALAFEGVIGGAAGDVVVAEVVEIGKLENPVVTAD